MLFILECFYSFLQHLYVIRIIAPLYVMMLNANLKSTVLSC